MEHVIIALQKQPLMLKKILIYIFILLPSLLYSEDMHLHNEINAKIIIEKRNIHISLIIPENILKNKTSQKIISQINTIKNSEPFSFYTKENWYSNDKKITKTKTKPNILLKEQNQTISHSDHHDHIINLNYKLPEVEINSIQTNIFSLFPQLKKLTCSIITQKKQFTVKLYANKQKIKL